VSALEPQVLDIVPPTFPGITDPKKRALLGALCSTPSQLQAAIAAKISPKTIYNWLHSDDEAFKAGFPVALEMGCLVAEREGWLRGVEGWLEPVYQGGRLVGYIRKKSDTMLIFMLKGGMPAKYRERFEHTGADGAPLFALPVNCLPDCGNKPKKAGDDDPNAS
jgi:hypothetical protein